MSLTPALPPVSGLSLTTSESPLWSQGSQDPGSRDLETTRLWPLWGKAFPLVGSPWATSPSPVGVSGVSNTREADSCNKFPEVRILLSLLALNSPTL